MTSKQIEVTTDADISSIEQELAEHEEIGAEFFCCKVDQMRALIARIKIEREQAVRECAEICDKFDCPVSTSEFVNGQSTASQQIRARILSLIDRGSNEPDSDNRRNG